MRCSHPIIVQMLSVLFFCLCVSAIAQPQTEEVSAPEPQASADVAAPTEAPEDPEAALQKKNAVLNQEVEDLKQAALNLNRDLLLLEEELLFPGNTQVAVFVSMDVGEFFQLDAVKVKIDDQVVGSHLYTEKQVSALTSWYRKGGISRLSLGDNPLRIAVLA